MIGRRWIPLVLTAAVAATSMSACGDDDDDDAAADVAASATESSDGGGDYEIVSDQAVATGFAATLTLMEAATAAGDAVDSDAFDEVHESWESFEGTVKQQEPDTYLAAEEALASFEAAVADGDAPAMQAATDQFRAASETYLAAHPG